MGHAPYVTVLVEAMLLHASGLRPSFIVLCRTFILGHGVLFGGLYSRHNELTMIPSQATTSIAYLSKKT